MTTTKLCSNDLDLGIRAVAPALAGFLVLSATMLFAFTPRAAVAHQVLTVPATTEAITATVRFAQSTITTTVNVPVVVELVVEDAELLSGWQTMLVFDPAQLQITSVESGVFLAGLDRVATLLGPWSQSASHMALGGYSYGPPPGVSGSGVLAQITIIPLAVGNTTLEIVSTMLTSLDNSASVQLQPHIVSGAEILVSPPLAVTLESFEATSQSDGILITWVTVSEFNNSGFNLYRASTPAVPETFLAFVPSQSPGNSQGNSYAWLDSNVVLGESYYYWLEDVTTLGSTTLHGPIITTFQAPTVVTVRGLAADSAVDWSLHWHLALASCSILLLVSIYLIRRALG